MTPKSQSSSAGKSAFRFPRARARLRRRVSGSLLALDRLHACPELELQVMAEVPAPFLSASLARIRVADAHLVQLRLPRLARLTNRVRHRSSHLPAASPARTARKKRISAKRMFLC